MIENHTVSEVARFFGVSKLSYQIIYKEWCTTGGHEMRNYERTRPKPGRLDKISVPRGESHLVSANWFQTRQTMLQSVNKDPSKPVSNQTLRKELHPINI